jgi:hypothetical protein
MYCTKDPTKDPGYFNFSSHTDVNRLAKVIDSEIVIYFADDRKFQFFELYHDFRGFSRTETTTTTTNVLYYVVTVQRKLYKFYRSLDNIFEGSGYFFGLERSRLYGREDYGVLLARLLKVSAPDFPVASLLDLAFSTERLYSLWQKKVILVNFCKSNFNQKELRNSSRRTQPRFSYFFNLGLIGPPGAESVKETELDTFDTAVCFYAKNFACILKEPYRLAVLEQYKQTTRRDKPSKNDFDEIPVVSLEEKREALAKVTAKKAAKKKSRLLTARKKIAGASCAPAKSFLST